MSSTNKPLNKFSLLIPIILIILQITYQFYSGTFYDNLYFPPDEEGTLDKCVCDGDDQYDMVDECCCKMKDVDEVNDQILPILNKLMSTTFFRYYKV